ncbi:MAG: hypothetical protein J6A15_08910 [Clostridia bacterium]|nr:hypothetical protein [Clostridia bacterium]
MERKRGMSKIAIILIVVVILILIAAGTFFAIWYIKSQNKPQEEIKLYEEYTEGAGFLDEDSVGEEMTPLANGLKEYRNDELGIRFGYLDNMELPEDEQTEDGTFISTIKSASKSTEVVLKIGKIDVSQSDIDHVQKQKEAVTQELIKAETKIIEVEENGKKVQKTIVPEKVSDITVSNTLFADQLAVRFSYTENGLMVTRVLTIKGELVYSLTYKASQEEYSYSEESKVFESFEFINKFEDIKADELNTVIINGKEYSLPIKVTNIEGLTVDSKYASQRIEPNYFTIVSLYETQIPKYSAYVYNAKASVSEIERGYITAISTDVSRGGNLVIYKGVELGTVYSKVSELLGSPSKQYYSDDETTLTNIYQIDNTTIQLKFRNDDGSKPNQNSKVVAILFKVTR